MRVRIRFLLAALMTGMLAVDTALDGATQPRSTSVTSTSSKTRAIPCPVDETQYNNTAPDGARCFCTPGGDIRCHGGVQSVPTLVVEHVRHAHGETTFGGLYASSQQIGGVPAYAFSELAVARVVLNFNPMGHRQGLHPHAFAGFTLGLSLRELHLGGCRLRHLPTELVRDLVDLRRLHLWANELDLLPVGLFNQPGGGGRNLIELSLWGNRIEEIEQRTFEGLRKLRFLDLDRNRIYMIDARAFDFIPELRCLRLAGNHIRVIYEDTFLSVPHLQVLNLDKNGLGYVYTSAFDAVSTLLSLSLSDNVIAFLPDDVFSALRRLRDLRLAGNRLTHVWAGTFAGLSQLARLDLSSNQIVHLPPGAFRHAPYLRHVRLDNNRLTALDRCSVLAAVPDSFKPSSSVTLLRTLSFIGNAGIGCDCRLAWVAELQTASPPTFVWGACSGTLRSIIDIVANDTNHCEAFSSDACIE